MLVFKKHGGTLRSSDALNRSFGDKRRGGPRTLAE
jgi:hypothetical protein